MSKGAQDKRDVLSNLRKELFDRRIGLVAIILLFLAGGVVQYAVYYLFCVQVGLCVQKENLFTATTIMLIVLVFLYVKKFDFGVFATKRLSLKSIVILLVTIAALYHVDTRFINPTVVRVEISTVPTWELVNGLATRALGSLFDEVYYRGLLLPLLLNKFGISLGIILTSAIWAFVHYGSASTLEVIFLFSVGVVLSLGFLKTQNLLWPIALHVALNVYWFKV